MAEKRGDACVVYLLSFMLVKQKFLIFKKGIARQKGGSSAPNDPPPPRYAPDGTTISFSILLI